MKVGEPLTLRYEIDGIYQNQAEVDALPSSSAAVGAVKFKDLDGDGEITTKDRKIIGNANPKFIFVLAMTFIRILI